MSNQKKISAAYPDEHGNLNKLCSTHAKERGCWKGLDPCRDCPNDNKVQANYPDEVGHPKKLCATHAEQAGCYQVSKPCRDCPEHNKLSAGYEDEYGNSGILCASHAKIVHSYKLPIPCKMCPCEMKISAFYPDEYGTTHQLCAEHAKQIGTYELSNLCERCLIDEIQQTSSYSNEHGISKKLCAEHAKQIGTYVKLKPCRDCSIKNKVGARYCDENGKANILCAKHAYALGLISKPVSGCSKIACEVWDKLEIELNVKLQHAHFTSNVLDLPSTTDEYRIPNTKYRVDAFDLKNKMIFEFYGHLWHGYNPDHEKFHEFSPLTKKSNEKMYLHTMERMKFISEMTDFTIHYIWKDEYLKIRKTAHSLKSIIHIFK